MQSAFPNFATFEIHEYILFLTELRGHFWIGAKKEGNDPDWRWTQSNDRMDYKHWITTSTPRIDPGRRACVRLQSSSAGAVWMYSWCQKFKFNFICEKSYYGVYD